MAVLATRAMHIYKSSIFKLSFFFMGQIVQAIKDEITGKGLYGKRSGLINK